MTIRQELQVLNQTSGFVELHVLDCSVLGGGIYRFTPNVYADGTSIVWAGNTYSPIAITSTGWTLTSSGAQPQPTITVTNANRTLLAAVIGLGDIAGASYTRFRTYQKFLDGQPAADSTQYLGPDTYVVYQKKSHTNLAITWQLASLLDRPGLKLPARQALKDGDGTANSAFPGMSVYQGR